MKAIVLYRTKYGSTKAYAEWIGEALGCEVRDAKGVKADELLGYDKIVYGGGLYAEVIFGVSLITKNFQILKDKKIAIYTTGITPLDCRAYYDGEVLEKNFKNGVPDNVKVFNFMGKMIIDELSIPHKLSLKALKKVMSARKNPTEMEKLLIELCDASGDFTDRAQIKDLLEYMLHND